MSELLTLDEIAQMLFQGCLAGSFILSVARQKGNSYFFSALCFGNKTASKFARKSGDVTSGLNF